MAALYPPLSEERCGDVDLRENTLCGGSSALGPHLIHDISHSLLHIHTPYVPAQQQQGGQVVTAHVRIPAVEHLVTVFMWKML